MMEDEKVREPYLLSSNASAFVRGQEIKAIARGHRRSPWMILNWVWEFGWIRIFALETKAARLCK